MSREKQLNALLTGAALRRMAGDTYFDRGEAYFARGAVKDLKAKRNRVTASVSGTQRYTVRIWADRAHLDWSCTCPLGEEGEFCKHVVATGLAWLARPAPEPAGAGEEESSVEHYLRAADKSTLVELLIERIGEDPDLEAWLLLKAQRQGVRDDQIVMRTIDQAFELHEYLAYDETPAFVSKAEHAVALLEGMLGAGDYRATAELSEYALRRGFEAYDQVDDSRGSLGDLLHRIAAVHLEACENGALLGEHLAERLFSLVLDDQWGVVSATGYRRALGAAGWARFAQIVREQWEGLRALRPNSRDDDRLGHRSVLNGLMRDIAAESGDVDQMVEVEKGDLSTTTGFLRIAELLTQAKRHDEAFEWAQRGVAAFPLERVGRLRDFLVGAYLRRKDYERALALRWEEFESSATAHSYEVLKQCATTARAWPLWRERALAHLKALAAKQARGGDWGYGPSAALVEIHLNEDDLPAALAQARAGGCGGELWRRLAQASEGERPEDAIAIYRARLDPVIGGTNKHAYDDAAVMLRKIGVLMRRHGQASAFLDLLGTVMTRHKAKRNLMKLLEGVAAEARKAGVRGDGG